MKFGITLDPNLIVPGKHPSNHVHIIDRQNLPSPSQIPGMYARKARDRLGHQQLFKSTGQMPRLNRPVYD
jgi:hypothetical protein